MAQHVLSLRWRTIVLPAVLFAAGLVAHLISPSMGWGLVGSFGGGLVASIGALTLMGSLHGHRLACPNCGGRLPFGRHDGHEQRIVTCGACHAQLHVTREGLFVMPEGFPRGEGSTS